MLRWILFYSDCTYSLTERTSYILKFTPFTFNLISEQQLCWTAWYHHQFEFWLQDRAVTNISLGLWWGCRAFRKSLNNFSTGIILGFLLMWKGNCRKSAFLLTCYWLWRWRREIKNENDSLLSHSFSNFGLIAVNKQSLRESADGAKAFSRASRDGRWWKQRQNHFQHVDPR